MKNTSTIDFSLPILWKLRQKYPLARITMMYTTINRTQILRDSTFVNIFCIENKIDVMDLSDFLIGSSPLLKKIMRAMFKETYSDNLSINKIKELKYKNLKALCIRYLRPLERILTRVFLNKNFLAELNPDIILFDNRTTTTFIGRDELYKYIELKKIPTILLPHAPHYINPTDEFCGFDEKNNDAMPKYTEHWMPFRFGTPWDVLPKQKEQFIYIGYPGLDSKWKNYLLSKETKRTNNILIMTRKFLSKGMNKSENYDPFTLTYDEVYYFYKRLSLSLVKIKNKPTLYIKPHPSSSKIATENILKEVGIKDYIITYELFYDLLPKIDRVITQFTTSIALPIAYNIPTLIVADKLQKYVNSSWSILEVYYKGLTFYSSYDDFENNINNLFSEEVNRFIIKDYKHLREFFDDGSINRAIERIEYLYKGYIN
jgi:hypothetical protein